MNNYIPVESNKKLEEEWLKALLVFFELDQLFSLDLLTYNSLIELKNTINNLYPDNKIRELVNGQVKRIETYHHNNFNYQFPFEHYSQNAQYKKDIELLKLHNYVYIKHYVEELTFIVISALSLTLLTGTREDFLFDYLLQKRKSFIDTIEMFADDDTIKMVDNLTMTKFKIMGLDEYIWQTREDDRVRHSHQLLNHEKMRWSKPDPKEGHPGSAPRCRCVAIPVRDDTNGKR